MPIATNSKEAREIRKFIPLSTMPISRFERICEKIDILTAEPGEMLFKRGDNTTALFYLLSGEVSLQAAGMQVEVIDAQSYSGRFALAHHNPRKINAVALSSLRYLRLDADWLIPDPTNIFQEDNINMTGNEPEDNPDDWMTTLLNSPVFISLPPANLQKILMSLDEVQVAKGTVVLKQGDMSEHYYLIKQGHCIISRKPNPNAREIKLAQLRSSDTFGEDSLLSERPVSVSVTALTDLILLRLPKEKFVALIKNPTLKYLEAAELETELNTGAYIVDVRSQDEFIAKHLKGSISAPFFTLLMQIKTFDRKKPIIVACEDGKTSAAGAFLLLRNKFEAKVLRNGLASLPADLSGDVVGFEHNAQLRKTFIEEGSPATESDLDTIPSSEATNTSLLEQLIAENKQLKAILMKLKQKCDILQQEKAAVEKRCQELAQQMALRENN